MIQIFLMHVLAKEQWFVWYKQIMDKGLISFTIKSRKYNTLHSKTKHIDMSFKQFLPRQLTFQHQIPTLQKVRFRNICILNCEWKNYDTNKNERWYHCKRDNNIEFKYNNGKFTSLLHIGQVLFPPSHVDMHCKWNACPHLPL